MTRNALNAVVWAATLLGLIVGGLVAAIFVVMPTSLDPMEMVQAGVEPWSNALFAAAAFLGLVIVAIVGLVFWHSARFRSLGLALTIAQIAAVVFACAKVYADYF